MKIAVLSQYCDSPIALTSEATHEGPVFAPAAGVIGVAQVGVIQLTARSFPFATSLKNCVCGEMTSLLQSGPL